MTTRSFAPVLPAATRRALWSRVWRERLLVPHEDIPAHDPQDTKQSELQPRDSEKPSKSEG